MKNLTIGIEIEMTGITRETAANVVARHFNTTSTYKGGAYDAYEVTDNTGRIWSIKRDSSIKPQRIEDGEKWGASDEYRVEFISPILTYGDIADLQELVREIRKAGGFVNCSCGMHVHIGANDFTAKAAHNLINALASKQDLIFKALNIYDNRVTYCHKIDEYLLNRFNERKPKTMAQLASVWYDEPEEDAVIEHSHYDSSRYRIVNLHALFTKGTVEFRMFNSTLHAGEVKAAIQFCLALMHQAKTAKKAIYRKVEPASDKFAFRTWMRQLGLNGDEFKTCRHHWLKNLTGSTYRAQATA